jgi:hypothetical protein
MILPVSAGPTNLNRVGLTLYIDTMIIDAADEASVFLRRLHDGQWIYLQRTDAMDADLATAPASKAARLTGASALYSEMHGPVVPGQTRQGRGVRPSPEDEDRLELVRQTLHGAASGARRDSNDLRDAMHVATAIRYGGYGFVTCDVRVLTKARAISEAFNGFQLLSPAGAVDAARTRITGMRRLHDLEPMRGPLPEWPHETDFPSGAAAGGMSMHEVPPSGRTP